MNARVESKTPTLFSEYRLRDVMFRNRLVVSPMQMYMTGPDGIATDWHFQHLVKWSLGGFGTVSTEALMIDPVGRNTYGDCGIWGDEHVAPLRRITDFLHERGSLALAQIHHAGPKASRQRPWEGLGPLGEAEAARGEAPWQPVSASATATLQGWQQPRALTAAEIDVIIEKYAAAAERADRAGFDVLEVHAAHGYLIHSFLSPLTNFRQDDYGGGMRGRMRIALKIAEAVRTRWPAGKPLFFRLSAVDATEPPNGGSMWTLEDSCVLARELKDRGVDVIDCSSGGIRSANSVMDVAKNRSKLRRGFQVPYARAIRSKADIPTMAVGVILDGPQAEEILQDGSADLIAIGREALTDPHWALHAAQALSADPEWHLWPRSYGYWLSYRDRIGIE
ncbi:2,4-dienoyl-CoA reductase-like NADH-dependent reductase (Old Yellow Enzyme family) [Paraburkholderia sp. WC7.3g]|uniref:NADH:flavin oxidoreductase/NADH oxidase n=1 Tax=Paraburkholderia podalyriae TaxID=1938811 RepID=A0ABR7PHT7_9BURK|nr:NADH:flavin oxidoreductase/NADH oxidase [Paraburkholderia podalyriae]MBC8745940.1 NADH:flavin oxidoreductase/NADH oxidase [Paraburkholderia podalyriae]